MKLALLLPWFPIILSVGVAARLMRRERAIPFGICAALFWIVLAQTGVGQGAGAGSQSVWSDSWAVVALLAGSVAIIGMAAWAGDEHDVQRSGFSGQGSGLRVQGSAAAGAADSGQGGTSAEHASPRGSSLDSNAAVCAGEAITAFDDWLERHRSDGDPWPVFDEFVRSVLYQMCHAAHVRLYRVLSEGDALVPLAEVERGTLAMPPTPESARRGIVGHVVTTGCMYVAADPTQGELVQRLAAESDRPLDWCFAIQRGGRRIGVVVVGQLGHSPGAALSARRQIDRPALDVTAGLIQLFWTALAEVCRARAADQTDPVTGVLSRQAFLTEAETAAAASYHEHEPVAVAAISIEGLRRLDDAGKWDVANELVRGVAQLIRQKVRADDRVGRFDDARFLLLLRRVDSELASLIVEQILARLTTYCEHGRGLGAHVRARCGLAGSGTDAPPITALIARALTHCHEAREQTVMVATDLGEGTPSAKGSRLAKGPQRESIDAGEAATPERGALERTETRTQDSERMDEAQPLGEPSAVSVS